MRTLQERPFHILMAALVFGSLFLDDFARRSLPAWNPPPVGFITFALGLVWVGMLTHTRSETHSDRARVAEDRIERLERRVAELEDETRARNRSPLERG